MRYFPNRTIFGVIQPWFVLLCLLVISASGQDRPSDEVIRVDTSLVSVPISVLDRDGRYISGLSKEKFSILEDGMIQEIDYFASTDSPVTVLLLLDSSGSMASHLQTLAGAANSFIRRLKPDDQLLIASFGVNVEVVVHKVRISSLPLVIELREMGGQDTRVYDAVDFGMRRLREISGRKAIILFTDCISSGDSSSVKKNLRDAEEQDAMIYTVRFGEISVPGPDRRPPNPITPTFTDGRTTEIITRADLNKLRKPPGKKEIAEQNQKITSYMSDLASKTGGRSFRIEEILDLDRTFAGIAAELSAQYTLGYYSNKPGKDGERRKIKVQVNRPDVAVRSRNEVVFKKSKN